MQVKDNLISLSTQKFSSNVVEKVIDVAPAEDLREIINQLAEATVVATLVYSSYGNFVVQKVSVCVSIVAAFRMALERQLPDLLRAVC